MDIGQAEDWLLDLARRHRLSPSQRQIVQRMLGMFPDVAFLSTIEISKRAGVSQPTVTRLATALGFAGYPDFRAALREAVLPSSAPAARVPSPRHSAIDQETANVAGLARAARWMPAAVEALAATAPLGVVGLRASAALADYFGYFARRALPAVKVCTDAGSADDFVLQLRQEGASAALFFAMPRYPAGTVSAIRLARGLGLTTVVIADTALAPFAGDADVLLVAPVGTGLVFDSHAAVVVLAISLLDAIAATDPGRTQERLEAHEALVDRWVY
ncbi:MurR/RpiR family transcriptional regulator [Paractinoplanes atraurantiacus]|uniref:DNA-binding transcriptional regulator, MurR/RpiR family, contains HTH and SIS domains n=1 Tax=Paractinoplanes atraurantiacus TaxID=1036182 RepID=A0A285K3T6_9ACTN|nr:MurR/RpiR family transcriptional regulator [Actinoplanes atraurantiacus]SNY67218.1 DNA-binding transcriptional regulator, MurR/RpiR family, contains HTH and SIS domains [Actinoplanes atraurantiacus]